MLTCSVSINIPSAQRIQEIIDGVVANYVGECATDDLMDKMQEEILEAVKSEFTYQVNPVLQ